MQTGGHKILIVILKGRYKSAYLKIKKKKTTNKQKTSLCITMLIEFNLIYPFVFYPKENTT